MNKTNNAIPCEKSLRNLEPAHFHWDVLLFLLMSGT